MATQIYRANGVDYPRRKIQRCLPTSVWT